MTEINNTALLAEVSQFLTLEADHIDRREWESWVDMFTEDSIFWMPAWRNEDELTEDPMTELSLIYLSDRGVQDRVFRFDSGDAYSASPLATTSHLVGNVRLLAVEGDDITVGAKALVSSMDPRSGTVTRSCIYEYRLQRLNGELKIKQKKVVLLELRIDGTIDVYNV